MLRSRLSVSISTIILVVFRFGNQYTTMEGGRRLMAAWRKEEVDAAGHRQKRETCYRRRECRILRSHTRWPSRRAEGILVRTRDRPETCVASVDASRDFTYFLRTSSGGGEGGGVCCQTFSFVLFSLFSRPRAGLATV